MKTKKVDSYIDEGFGFPVELKNATMAYIRDEWVLKINYNELSDAVSKQLLTKKSRLTGNEIKFIRTKAELTLQKFGKEFDVSHAAVIKWEKCGDEETKMSWTTEKDIRLFSYNSIPVDCRVDFYKLYKHLKTKMEGAKRKLKIDMKNVKMGLSLA